MSSGGSGDVEHQPHGLSHTSTHKRHSSVQNTAGSLHLPSMTQKLASTHIDKQHVGHQPHQSLTSERRRRHSEGAKPRLLVPGMTKKPASTHIDTQYTSIEHMASWIFHSKHDINPWIELAKEFYHGYVDDPLTKRRLQDCILQQACSEVFLTSSESSMCLFNCLCYFAFGEVSLDKAHRMRRELRAFELLMCEVDEDFDTHHKTLRTGRDDQGDALDARAFSILFDIPIRQLQFQLDAKNEPYLVRYIPYSALAATDAVRELKEGYELKHTCEDQRLRRESDFIGVLLYDFQGQFTLQNHFTTAVKEGVKSLTSVEEAYKYIFSNNSAYNNRRSERKSALHLWGEAGRAFDRPSVQSRKLSHSQSNQGNWPIHRRQRSLEEIGYGTRHVLPHHLQ